MTHVSNRFISLLYFRTEHYFLHYLQQGTFCQILYAIFLLNKLVCNYSLGKSVSILQFKRGRQYV